MASLQRPVRALLTLTVLWSAHWLQPAWGKPCASGCTKEGTCNEELGRCDCPRHLSGPACGEHLAPRMLLERCSALGFAEPSDCTAAPLACMGGCSGAGECVAGFCKCRPGHFGADCSLSLGRDGKPQLLAGRGYTPRSRGPRVYMYELPPEFTTWRNEAHLDRPTTHHFIERLTATGARVADGDDADWYFIPLTIRGRKDDFPTLNATISLIREVHPWWNKTMGHRHFIIALGDKGRAESDQHPLSYQPARKASAQGQPMSYEQLYEANNQTLVTENVTWVTHWGLYQDRDPFNFRASHRNATDVVLPVFLSTFKLQGMGLLTSRNHPLFGKNASTALRKRSGPTFFFAGRICGDRQRPSIVGGRATCRDDSEEGLLYSGGTRQMVHYHHWNRKGFYVKHDDDKYGEHMLTAKYCFGAMGGGHGQRQIQAVLAGCVPVQISDHVLEAFEPFLDWNKFGVRVAEKDIPRLHTVLGSISKKEYERKQQRLRCAAQHMAFSTVTGALMGESGRYDAFETLLEILRSKGEHPGVPPERLRSVDPRLDAFLDCRADDDEEAWEQEEQAQEKVEEVGRAVATRRLARRSRSSNKAEVEGVTPGVGGSQGRRQQLCSASPLDKCAQGVTLCSTVYDIGQPLYGGLMCASSPTELVRCPRPWA